MANLTNCQLCGNRERWYELSHFAGKSICRGCDELVFDLFDDPRTREAYVRESAVAQPKDIFGQPMEAA